MRFPSWFGRRPQNKAEAFPIPGAGRAQRCRRRGGQTSRDRRESLWMSPGVRLLERRRVLDASVEIIGVPAVIPEGTVVTAEAVLTDVNEVRFYDWTLYEGASLVDRDFAAATAVPPFMFTAIDDGSFTLLLEVFIDEAFLPLIDSQPFTVINVAPTAMFSNDGPVDEGLSAMVTFSGQMDPGVEDVAAGFRYSYDFDDDGVWDVGDGSYAGSVTDTSQVVAASFLDDGPGTYTVKGRIIDKDDGFTDYTTDIEVINLDPTIDSLTITTPINEGDTATLSGTFTDPGVPDTHFLDIDWDGNGTFDETVMVSGGSFDVDHPYPDDVPTMTPSDTFDVNVRLRDDDGGMDEDSVSLTVNNVAPHTLAFNPVAMIDENGFAALSFSFVDPGTLDQHRVSIDWGDDTGVEDLPPLAVGTRNVFAFHQYRDDDPSGTLQDTYTIEVTLRDDDTGEVMGSTTVLVKNVDPVLTVADDQVVNEGDLLDLSGATGGPLLGSFTDVGTLDMHTATVDWGDGTAPEAVTVTQGTGSGTLAASHTYADDGMYTVTVTLMDDDLGVHADTFLVTVNNVAPVLTGVDEPPEINEGEIFTLTSLGVGLSDPGFDNPANMGNLANGGEFAETFAGMWVDWGDRSPAVLVPVTVVNRMSGSEGVPTTAQFEHAEHAYADNGEYTVSVRFSDDDGGLVTRTFQVLVHNVAPTLTLTDEVFVLNEGDVLTIPNLGSFTDPGFDNPLNTGDPGNGGETEEFFRYTINWGDGTVETMQLPASVVQGSQGVLTTGTLSHSHHYLDNDADNIYTITVTLSDDDGGVDERSFDITVFNVNPTLLPVSALDVNSLGETTLDLTFSDPGADEFEVLVDWGELLGLPPADRFVVETVYAGPTPQSFSLLHTYAGPPDPLNPTADIIITVIIQDDDFGTLGVFQIGESNPESVAISNPGINPDDPGQMVAIDTSIDVPLLNIQSFEQAAVLLTQQRGTVQILAAPDIRVSRGELAATSDLYLQLHVVDPDGTIGPGYRLSPEALDDLPGFFVLLPDGRYVIFLIRTETNFQRLVLDVTVRTGRSIDATDASDGTRDRPPTSEDELAPVPLEQNPLLERAPEASDDPAVVPMAGRHDDPAAGGSAMAGTIDVIAPVSLDFGSNREEAQMDGFLPHLGREQSVWERLGEEPANGLSRHGLGAAGAMAAAATVAVGNDWPDRLARALENGASGRLRRLGRETRLRRRSEDAERPIARERE